jgi:hypothetical protein
MGTVGGRGYPSTDMFDEEALDTVERAMGQTGNPIHRARYADFIWEQRHHHVGARNAIDAYLNASSVYAANRWDHELADAIDRAAELAQLLHDSDRLNRVKAAALDYAEQLFDDHEEFAAGGILSLLQTVQGTKHGVTASNHERMTELGERGAKLYGREGERALERDFLALLPASYRALGRPADAAAARERVSESFEAEALDASSALVRVVRLNDALQSYMSTGPKSKVDEMKRHLSSSGVDAIGEMSEVSTTLPIKREWLERWTRRQLLPLPMGDALAVLASSERFVPKLAAHAHSHSRIRCGIIRLRRGRSCSRDRDSSRSTTCRSHSSTCACIRGIGTECRPRISNTDGRSA